MKMYLSGLLLVCAGLASSTFAATPGEVEVGSKLRDVKMQGLAGSSANLSEFRGKPLIINVWASWCGPCRQEMASLERLSRRAGGKQLTVIGISTDDYTEAAEAMLRQTKLTFRQFIDRQLVLENMLGANRIPLTLLVDAQGKVQLKVYGVREWDDAQALALINKTLRVKL